MSASNEKSFSALLDEHREFPPSDAFKQQANASDPSIYQRAARDPQNFWAAEARRIDWFTPWQQVLEWKGPWVKRFVGGKLNVAYTGVARHAASHRRNKAAI